MMEQSESPSNRSSFIGEHPAGMDNTDATVERDYYAILEVASNASGDHLGGSYNRIYNRMIALQHNSPQTDATAANFKELSEAYEVLSDPVKRRAYDKRNQPATALPESIVGRALAIVSRFKAPTGPIIGSTPTPSTSGLTADVIDTVSIICQQGGIECAGPPMDPRVADMVWGSSIEGKADRQTACYYRLTASKADVENGFIVHCRSVSKDKFKLVIFDSSGTLLSKEESSRSSDKLNTEATLFFLSFSAESTQPDSPQLASNEPSQFQPIVREINSPLSDKMDSLCVPKRTVDAGHYLICVYADNLMVKASYNLIAVLSKNDAPEVSIFKHDRFFAFATGGMHIIDDISFLHPLAKKSIIHN